MCPRSRPLAARQTNRELLPSQKREREQASESRVSSCCRFLRCVGWPSRLVFRFCSFSFLSILLITFHLICHHFTFIESDTHFSHSLTLSHIPLFILLPRLPPPIAPCLFASLLSRAPRESKKKQKTFNSYYSPLHTNFF
ncbi:MAG: hypothetical protein BYD32DRAFT_232330 [Podila humilis]|nr:MAG: hypothetical protein BYD32DRAFT_232330 [Podila humilis]